MSISSHRANLIGHSPQHPCQHLFVSFALPFYCCVVVLVFVLHPHSSVNEQMRTDYPMRSERGALTHGPHKPVPCEPEFNLLQQQPWSPQLFCASSPSPVCNHHAIVQFVSPRLGTATQASKRTHRKVRRGTSSSWRHHLSVHGTHHTEREGERGAD